MTTPVDEFRITCPKCGYWLERSYWNQERPQPCAHCQTNLRLLVFPLAVEPAAIPQPNPNASQGDATCYNHAGKQAHAPCAVCGRFLCTVCDIEFRGEHWCPSCLKSQAEGQSQPVFQRSRMRFDSLALALVTIPALVISPSLLCAPTALFLCIRHWNDDPGFLPRTKVRLYLAALFGFLQVATWIGLFVLLYLNIDKLLAMWPR